MLSVLRNFDEEIIKILKKMPITIDIRRTFSFKEGHKEGEIIGEKRGEKRGEIIGEKKAHKLFAENAAIKLLQLGILNLKQIARIVQMPLKFVQEIKEKHDTSLIQNLLKKGKTDLESISKELKLPLEFVQKIQKEFVKKPPRNGT